MQFCDFWMLIDNSNPPSKVIAEGNTRENIKVWDQKIYDKIIQI